MRAYIAAALAQNEVCTIKYRGGSQPGSIRHIIPRSLDDDGYLRAFCEESGAVKTFRLDRIEVCDNEVGSIAPLWDPRKKFDVTYTTLDDLFRQTSDAMTKLGWHVQLETDHYSLHRRFKNGRPLKSADVSISYEEFTSDSFITDQGEIVEENVRKRQRPWTVRGKKKSATFGKLDRAAMRFLEWAEEHSPANL